MKFDIGQSSYDLGGEPLQVLDLVGFSESSFHRVCNPLGSYIIY